MLRSIAAATLGARGGVLPLLALTLLASACVATGRSPAREEAVSASPRQVTQITQVTYVDAVVYAGATHYYFSDADGAEIVVIESNDPGARKIRGADRLLEPDPIEGPPGPAPDLLNRPVILHHDDRGRVVAVQSTPE